MEAGGIWLQTARLRLKPLSLADEQGVLAGLNDPNIASWLATTPYPYLSADFRAYVAAAPMGETFAIHDSGGFVGLIGGGQELGFWVAGDAQGRGYATEAAIGLLHAVFEFYKGDVTSGYFVGNVPSSKVLGKIGFVATRQRLKYCTALDQDMEHVDMILTRDKFRKLHPVR
jgi:[ribosomal protein S5]-alanine N-acetyltransferase